MAYVLTGRWLLLAGLVLSGCSQGDDPDWQVALSASTADIDARGVTLRSPDAWAVAVAHSPERMGAVLSTQRLVSEWPALFGTEPVPAVVAQAPVTVSAPAVVDDGDVRFPATDGEPGEHRTTSLVLPHDRPLRYSFDLPPTTGWTYAVTFGPTVRSDTEYTADMTSPVTVAFEGDRHRSMPTRQALPSLRGRAHLVLLDNRTHTAVEVSLVEATLDGRRLILTTRNSAPTAEFNRGALFVDGLPTPA